MLFINQQEIAMRMSFLEFKQEFTLCMLEECKEDIPFPPTDLMRSEWMKEVHPCTSACNWISYCMAH